MKRNSSLSSWYVRNMNVVITQDKTAYYNEDDWLSSVMLRR
jgi:hypothetical protein